MEEDQKTGLSINRINKRFVILNAVDSTNEYAKRLLSSGKSEDFIVFSFEQISGRGRYGKSWLSPRGGAWFSLVLKISDIKSASALLFKSALALSDALFMLGIKAHIRWPNDVLIGEKKVSGCLIETMKGTDGRLRAILGIGININISEEVLREAGLYETATSLLIEAGEEYDVLDLMYAVASLTIGYFEKFPLLGADEIDRINSILYRKGKPVTLVVKGNEVSGLCAGISDSGLLDIIDSGNRKSSYGHSEVTMFR
ncbi:MAG: biotin--[acetyl-CoA-carboxylase] ligase [Actinobacteria bacterium]|nr:biotin--[acetyl-CoA-carboxylase] ligase [Actinomycetota bacterium]